MRNIILVGFMGTGKSAVAREVAKRRGARYCSTDELIEEREGMKIAEIFAKKGEAYFRGVEVSVVGEVSREAGLVIDAGGGIMTRDENVAALKESGTLISLTARVDVIHGRTKGRTHRPLLNVPDPRAKIEELLAARASYYAKADHAIDTSDLTISQVADKVLEFCQ